MIALRALTGAVVITYFREMSLKIIRNSGLPLNILCIWDNMMKYLKVYGITQL